jgi:acyl-CoA thioester hydrolase
MRKMPGKPRAARQRCREDGGKTEDDGEIGAREPLMHTLAIRVYYEDTDFSGAVYHANYLRFLERGRTEMVRAAGIDQASLHAATGLGFVVRRMAIEFLRPASMDDLLTVTTQPQEVRGASMTLRQEISRGEELLLTAEVVVAAVRQGRAVRIPDALRSHARAGWQP